MADRLACRGVSSALIELLEAMVTWWQQQMTSASRCRPRFARGAVSLKGAIGGRSVARGVGVSLTGFVGCGVGLGWGSLLGAGVCKGAPVAVGVGIGRLISSGSSLGGLVGTGVRSA